MDRLSPRTDLVAELIDLRDHPLPMFDQLPPARTLRDYPNEQIAGWGRTIDRADGYMVITPEYNHGYPASLKNLLDHVFPELNRKPIAFVGYGNVGGARAIEQLRLVAVEFEMAPLRHAVHILPDLLLPARSADPFTPDLLAPLDGRLDHRPDLVGGGAGRCPGVQLLTRQGCDTSACRDRPRSVSRRQLLGCRDPGSYRGSRVCASASRQPNQASAQDRDGGGRPCGGG